MDRSARLSRTVRFSLSREGAPDVILKSPRGNTHAGWPSMNRRAGAAWTASIEVEGRPDSRTGYLVGIDRIDAAVREAAIPRLLERHQAAELETPDALRILHEAVAGRLEPAPAASMLSTEPKTWWRVESDSMSTMRVRRRYEFSASHRLHLPELDDAANAELFGKCSNPHGHGHNYEIEVEVACADGHDALSIEELDALVDRTVIDRFDHKHLNLDLDDFKDRVASVENIAARCVELLRDPIGSLRNGPSLHAVTVWETPRTACTVHA